MKKIEKLQPSQRNVVSLCFSYIIFLQSWIRVWRRRGRFESQLWILIWPVGEHEAEMELATFWTSKSWPRNLSCEMWHPWGEANSSTKNGVRYFRLPRMEFVIFVYQDLSELFVALLVFLDNKFMFFSVFILILLKININVTLVIFAYKQGR